MTTWLDSDQNSWTDPKNSFRISATKGALIKRTLSSVNRQIFAAFWALLLCSCAPAIGGADNAPALFSEVQHAPQQPRSGEPVTITAISQTAPASLLLEYQIVEPGQYVALQDPAFQSKWVSVPMEKFHSETRFSAQVPGSAQSHRRLIRYRFKGADAAGNSFLFPPAPAPDSDEVPNFAYFVYDGTAPWKAAIQPKGRGAHARVTEYPAEALNQVHSYILIAKAPEVGNATWYQRTMDKEYRYTGTFVAHGRVYDHINFRARGGEWRYAMGKNMWKFDFHKSNRLAARDDYKRPYKSTWSKLNLRACIQQGDYGRRGEQGMYEAVGFRLFNLAGVESPRTHWISLRIVDGAEENPADQYKGDFWGLYLAIENEDGRFLDEHQLPDGNVFKMKFGTGELANHGKGQPTDGSDLRALLTRLNRRADAPWWSKNVDLPRYYSYRSILEAIHHYDLDAGKNYTFYLNPEAKKWQVIPWDIDLSWGDHMFGAGREPFLRPVLSEPQFRVEYENRQREIRDLLFNPDETGRLIDECAAIISRRGALSIVDADRAKWDYHPIMTSRHVISSKAGPGLFYQDSATKDFAGMVEQMKEYVAARARWIDRTILTDREIPKTPAIQRTGDSLTFTCSPFSGSGSFAALKWRLAEIDSKPNFTKKPARPGHYEITPTWESPELTEFKPDITVPAASIQAGHTYRVRARLKDNAGRWSHWSAPIQFTAK